MTIFKYEVANQCEFILMPARHLDREIQLYDKLRALNEEFNASSDEARRGELAEQLQEPPQDVIGRMWFALQAILVSAANAPKMLWGSGGNRTEERRPLREALETGTGSPLESVRLRNDFEHFDERLARWFKPGTKQPYATRNVWHEPTGNPSSVFGGKANRHFGLFDPVTRDVWFWTHRVYVPELVEEAERILPLAGGSYPGIGPTDWGQGQ